MDLFSPFVLLPIIAGALIIAWGAWFGTYRARSLVIDESAYPGLVRLRSATLVSRWLGLLFGIFACLAIVPLGHLGRFALTAPAVASMVIVVAILIGQYSARRAALTPGVAGLERRSWTHYPNPRSVLMTVGMLAVITVAAGFTTSVAAPDDLGRAGRALRTACSTTVWTEGVATVEFSEGTSSPFPGSFYTVPMAFALGLLAITVVVALVLVGRRPRDGSDTELVRVDDALRRITAEGILASAGLGLAGSVVLVAGGAYLQFGNAACTSVNIAASYLLAIIALGGLVVGVRSFVAIIIPGDGSLQ